MDEKDCMMLQYISEEQNITKAAERLYITQPALTYRLRQIEKEFGVPVIMKNGKGIKLTQEGEYLVTYSQKVLLDLRKTKEYVVNMRNEVEGHLRIGVSSYYGLYKLPPILKSFISTYPKVQINVDTGWSNEIYELLLQEDTHVGIVKGVINGMTRNISLMKRAYALSLKMKLIWTVCPRYRESTSRFPNKQEVIVTHR